MDHQVIKVLLIEDDPEDVALISLYLSEGGQGPRFDLQAVDRLSSGCQRLAQERFDAVLLDLVLPGGGGVEAFLKIREAAARVPIVVLTGLRDESLALEAVSLGAQDYLIKGTIEGRVLKRAIRYAIERQRLLAKVEYLLAKDLDGKVVIDALGVVRYVNPAAESLLGRRAKDLLDRPFPLELGERPRLDVVLSKDPERLAEIRCAEIEWAGAPARLATVRDVTEVKRVEQLKAEIKERMLIVDLKNEFMTSISHELRNPLTTVKTALQSLKEGLVGPMTQQQARFVDLAYRNVERQVKIINNILDLARFQSGKVKMELRRVALAPLIEERAQSYSISPKGPRLEFEVPPELPDIHADADLITQVLSNLIDNALRFAREKVVVRAEEVEFDRDGVLPKDGSSGRGRPGVMITVLDDGPGMAEQQMSRLFTKFVQVSRPSGGSGYKGTGLGLAICKEIVSGHGGRIWAESSPGKGARFHFVIPVMGVPSHAL